MKSLLLSVLFTTGVYASLKDLADCDSSKKNFSGCPPDSAFASNATFDFIAAVWNEQLTDFWSIDEATEANKRRLTFDDDGNGMTMVLSDEDQTPKSSSRNYLFFGKISVEAQAAAGKGVVTAISLKSDLGDEIEWELLGAYENQAQSNYFFNGEAVYNTYNTTYPLTTSTAAHFHTYSIEWTPSSLVFAIDSHVLKIWQNGDIPSDKWPQTPMRLSLSMWSVKESQDDGEVDWAGGLPDWKGDPFKAEFRKVEVEDYVGYCKEVEGDVEYSFDEKMTGWEDVEVTGCKKQVVNGHTVTITVASTSSTSVSSTSVATSTIATSTAATSSTADTSQSQASQTETVTTLSSTSPSPTENVADDKGQAGGSKAKDGGDSEGRALTLRDALSFSLMKFTGLVWLVLL